MPYRIQPMNEPDGEGAGWDDCADDVATMFLIIDTAIESADEQGAVDYCNTRAEAEAFIKSAGGG